MTTSPKKSCSRPKARDLLPYTLAFLLLLSSCSQPKHPSIKLDQHAYYTCSMHPQVHVEKPGDCPICGMRLIKVEKKILPQRSADSGVLLLTRQQLLLGGIKVAAVTAETSARTAQLTGTVRTNETQSAVMSARAPGRIVVLFVRSTGKKIAIGTPLYRLYSEDLRLAESEYLLAREQAAQPSTAGIDSKAFLSAAENKLLLRGLTKGQLENIYHRHRISYAEIISSTVQGTVSELLVHEGDYVSEGSVILKTQHLSALWVEAQAYASEPTLHTGDKTKLVFPDLPGKEFSGQVSFIQPELAEGSKIFLVRIPISNASGTIRPGMQAAVSISSLKAKDLVIPSSALISDGKNSSVWLEEAAGKFVKRKVIPGEEFSDKIPVVFGLMHGDRVVTEGVYLLNSEALLKNVASPTQMDPNMKM